MRFQGLFRSSVLAAAIALVAPSASAAFVFQAGTGNYRAEVSFSQAGAGAPLSVTLTNTSTADTLVPSDVLTAVFFTVSGSPTLTPVSALLGAGSTVFYDAQGQPAGGVVGGEWAYRSGLTGAPGGARAGISSAGFSLFGPGDLFPGPDLQSPTSPNGVEYGILSAGDNAATGNGGITGSGGLIRNAVVFLFNVPSGLLLTRSDVNNVSFQYGTALNEPNFAVPAPDSAILLMAGLAGLGGVLRVRRR